MSAAYWEARYLDGGTSGSGSEGMNAEYKAAFLNAFVRDHDVVTVVEFGCGDGGQLTLAEYPSYIGLDVSTTAIELCRERFHDAPFMTFAPLPWTGPRCDLALSLDVIYHLTEDDVYEQHLRDVFAASLRWVILYTSDGDEDPHSARHVRHRRVVDHVARSFPGWRLYATDQNPHALGGCDFFVYQVA